MTVGRFAAAEHITHAMAADFGLVILPMPLDLPPSPLYIS